MLLFVSFTKKNYKNWLYHKDEESPTMSHTLIHDKVFPLLGQGKKVFLLLIDNLRYDQWKNYTAPHRAVLPRSRG